jgi:hypothetical protein
MSNSWLWWTVPQDHVRRYIVMMILVMFIIPNYFFGIQFTKLGFLLNLIWYDIVFYSWYRMKNLFEGDDE